MCELDVFVLVLGEGGCPSSSPSHHGQMDGLRKGFDNAPPAEFWFHMLLPPTIFFFLLVVIKMVIASLSPCLTLCEKIADSKERARAMQIRQWAWPSMSTRCVAHIYGQSKIVWPRVICVSSASFQRSLATQCLRTTQRAS